MRSMRRKIDAALKAKVAVEAIRGEKTIAEIASPTKYIPTRSVSGRGKP